MNRRKWLYTVGSSLSVAIPGCMGTGNNDEPADNTPRQTEAGDTPTTIPEERSTQESTWEDSPGDTMTRNGLELTLEEEKDRSRQYFTVTNKRSERVQAAVLATIETDAVEAATSQSTAWRYIYDLGSGETRRYYWHGINPGRTIALTDIIWTESQTPIPFDADVTGTFAGTTTQGYEYEYPNPTAIDSQDIRNVSVEPTGMPEEFLDHVHESPSMSVDGGSLSCSWAIIGEGGVVQHWELWGQATIQSLESEETFTFGPERVSSLSLTNVDFVTQDTGSDFKLDTIEMDIRNDSEFPVLRGKVLLIARDPVFTDTISEYECRRRRHFNNVQRNDNCIERVATSSNFNMFPDRDDILSTNSVSVDVDKNIRLPLPDSSEVVLAVKSGYSIVAFETFDLQSYI